MAHILVIDGDPIMCELASDILISAGHACGWVHSADEAMRLLRWRRPDLVLLEQNMPHTSGRTLLRELRQSAQHYDLPVIMFTAAIGRVDEQLALYNGANDYIRKPVDPDYLVFKVNEVLAARENHPRHRNLRDMSDDGMAITAAARSPRQMPI